MLDELQLLRGVDLKINDYITVRHPTLKEICEFGESLYWSLTSRLCSTPSDYKWQLEDMGMNYEDVDEFSFFRMLCSDIQPSQSGIFLGNLDLRKFQISRNAINGEIVLWDSENDFLIDSSVYLRIAEFIRKLHGFKKRIDKSGNEAARQALIEDARFEYEISLNKPHKSSLVALVSPLVNCEQFKYSYETVWDLPIYVFMNAVHQVQRVKNYDHIMGGAYAGTLDLKKISKEQLTWLGDTND